jgi:hypothetical protein
MNLPCLLRSPPDVSSTTAARPTAQPRSSPSTGRYVYPPLSPTYIALRLFSQPADPTFRSRLTPQKKIVIYAKSNIEAGDEITYDYHFPLEQEKVSTPLPASVLPSLLPFDRRRLPKCRVRALISRSFSPSLSFGRTRSSLSSAADRLPVRIAKVPRVPQLVRTVTSDGIGAVHVPWRFSFLLSGLCDLVHFLRDSFFLPC